MEYKIGKLATEGLSFIGILTIASSQFSLKTPESIWFSGDFRGVKMGKSGPK